MIAAFSTGSQAQYPPQPRTSYAQRPPRRLPTDRKNHEVRAQRRVVRIHTSPSLPVARAAIAKAKGTEALTYPRYKQGGWIVIQQFCKSGYSSDPSVGLTA